MSDGLRVETRDGACILTVDRPDTKNAIDPSLHDALADALDRVDGHVRGVVLTGAGASFVSGGDLKLIRARPFEETLELSARMNALLDRLEAMPIVVVAAINGWALGGGCEVALACDYRVAERDAQLSFRHGAMGLTTGWGATTRLARLVPRGVALRLLTTAETMGAEPAAQLGLVDEVVDEGQAVERALALIASMGSASPRAVAAFKRTVRAAYELDAARSRAVEWEEFRALWGGEDHREALEAFFAKRAPRWP